MKILRFFANGDLHVAARTWVLPVR